MYSLTVRDRVMIAHSFTGAVFGPAQALHGATFVVEATFRRATLDADGLVVDIGAAASALRAVLARLEYKNLDDVEEFAGINTTTEFLSSWIADQIAADPVSQGPESLEVLLRESDVAWGSYQRSL